MTRFLLVVLGVLLVAIAALGLAWRHDHALLVAAKADAAQKAEAAELERKGVIAAARVAVDVAKHELDLAQAESATFKAAVEKAQAAAPKAKLERVATLSSDWVPATAQPYGPPEAPAAAAAAPSCPPCLMLASDPGRIIARIAEARAEHGTLTIAGVGTCLIRRGDTPVTLFEAKFSAETSHVLEVAPPAPETPASLWLSFGAEYRARELAKRPDVDAKVTWKPLPIPLDLSAALVLLPDNTLDARGAAHITLRIR